MRSIAEFIEALGGASKVAKERNRPASTVASWKDRNSIPVGEWPPLIDLAQQCGIAGFGYEQLVSLHTGTPKSEQVSNALE
jgi:hypothetical protein